MFVLLTLSGEQTAEQGETFRRNRKRILNGCSAMSFARRLNVQVGRYSMIA
jgi:hypothetical protein